MSRNGSESEREARAAALDDLSLLREHAARLVAEDEPRSVDLLVELAERAMQLRRVDDDISAFDSWALIQVLLGEAEAAFFPPRSDSAGVRRIEMTASQAHGRGRPELAADAWHALAGVQLRNGDIDRAIDAAHRALDQFAAAHDSDGVDRQRAFIHVWTERRDEHPDFDWGAWARGQ